MAVSNNDKQRVFEQFRVSMGAPLRQIELTDDMLCVLLEISIEDYAQYTQEWLIEHQWQSLLGKNIDTTDMAFALSVRDFDFMTQYTYAYSKQVGLQARGPWELKKDYIDIESGRQVYEIPAGREVNEVLWVTPPTTQMALFANYAGIDYGFGGGYGQLGSGGGGGMGAGGNGGYYISPAYDILLTASDLNLKNRLLRSELVYKLTAGPNGTRLLHLLSTPGSKFTFGHGVGGNPSSVNLTGCQVWYHYYETNGDADECRKENSDIIKLPNEVPLAKLDYSTFNEPTKTLIRQLFVAESKRALGRTRGKFGGIVGPPEAERTMDYDSLLSEGNEERKAILERLDTRLERLSSTKQLERGATEAEFLNKSLKFRPLGFYVK
tara:strand:- start:40847 stop:41986 length:1140 start_codon:yes stop_codon:yes gene_type:complete